MARDPRTHPRPGDVTEATSEGVSVFIPALYVVQRVTADRVWYVDLLDRTRELQDVELVEWRHFAAHDRVLAVAPDDGNDNDDELVVRQVRHLRVIEGGGR